MPLSLDGKERSRVGPKKKKKRSKSFTLHLVWVKRVCIIQTISPGEDWSHRDLGSEAQLLMCFWKWFQLQELIALRTCWKLVALGLWSNPLLHLGTKWAFFFTCYQLVISIISLSLSGLFLALAHLSYVGISKKHFSPQARSWCKLIFIHSEETWLSKTSKNFIIKCFNDAILACGPSQKFRTIKLFF